MGDVVLHKYSHCYDQCLTREVFGEDRFIFALWLEGIQSIREGRARLYAEECSNCTLYGIRRGNWEKRFRKPFPILLSLGPQTARSFPPQTRLSSSVNTGWQPPSAGPNHPTITGGPHSQTDCPPQIADWVPTARHTVLLRLLTGSPQIEQMILFSKSSQRTLSQTYP